MLGDWVVPRSTRAAPDRKRLFFRGGGVQKGNSLAVFLAFPMAVCPHGCSPVAVDLVHATFTRTPVDLVSPFPRCYVALCL